MATTNKAKIPVGFVIAGKYRVTGELGRGGMAAVYKAENVDIGKHVAIKVLAQELISSTVVVERFLREARAVAAIRSPHICDVYDSGRLEDGRPFLVLELLEGESLYERMTRVGQIDVATTVAVITQTCKGLAKAHAANIVHRDLKPENIYITKDEEGRILAKILDFGLAKFYSPMDNGNTPQARLTREGAVFGTPAYMSPEQVRGQGAVDARADLWALGCITYESLTGRTVWATEQGVAMTFAQIANAPLPDPLTIRPDLPESFRDWYARSLDRNIEKRFQTPKEFSEALCRSLGVAPLATVTADEGDELGHHRPPQSSNQAFGSGMQDEPTTRGSREHFAARRTTRATGDSIPVQSSSGGRTALTILATGAVIGAAYGAYRVVSPSTGQNPNLPASALVDGGPATSATPSGSGSGASASAPPGPAYRPVVARAQEAIASGDLEGSVKLLKEAYNLGGHGMPKVLLEHVEQALDAKRKGAACTLVGLGRPRTYDLREEKVRVTNAGSPSIAIGPSGPIVTWTEAKDGDKLWAYSAALDDAMRTKGDALPITTEGFQVQRPQIQSAGSKVVLSYWEARPPDLGAYVRHLDADGRVASQPVKVGDVTGGSSLPAMVTLKDGSHVVVWVSPTDRVTDNVYLRRVSADLAPTGERVQVTALKSGLRPTRIKSLAAAIDDHALHVVARVDRDNDRLLQHVRIPLADIDKGVPEKGLNTDRSIGEMVTVNTDRARLDQVDVACAPAAGTCFATWGDEAKPGSSAALFQDPNPVALKRDPFTRTGRRPTITVDAAGGYRLFFHEAGPGALSYLVTSAITRDNATPPIKFARVFDNQPAPVAVPGRKAGEWYVTWLDNEVGHPEVFAARIECK